MIVAIFDLPGFSKENYDDIVAELRNSGGFPENHRLSHVAFMKGNSISVIDVWTSQEELMKFGQERLFPIFGKLGLTPPPPQIFPTHHFVTVDGEELTSA
jgi:hypothetical protein